MDYIRLLFNFKKTYGFLQLEKEYENFGPYFRNCYSKNILWSQLEPQFVDYLLANYERIEAQNAFDSAAITLNGAFLSISLIYLLRVYKFIAKGGRPGFNLGMKIIAWGTFVVPSLILPMMLYDKMIMKYALFVSKPHIIARQEAAYADGKTNVNGDIQNYFGDYESGDYDYKE